MTGMDQLIGKLTDGTLTPFEERRLVRMHQQHFRRRVCRLDPAFFPGRENSDAGIESLGGEAYASFRNEPTHQGEPAFRYVQQQGYPKTSFLYYWRNSATIQFLRRIGDSALRDRLNLLRNVRIHLHREFVRLGQVGRDWLWAAKNGPKIRDPQASVDVDGLAQRLGALRGLEAIRKIFEHAEMPLTRAEVAAVLARRSHQLSHQVMFGHVEEVPELSAPPKAENAVLAREARERATAFWHDLDDDEKRLLGARGYGRAQNRLTSHRKVAETTGTRSAEGWRLIELSILKRFAEQFPEPWEADEARTVIETFAREVEV